MNAWWRVLRGVLPYKWSVILSIVCALGVGFSYAAGVSVMLPVLKIFISAEGVHGWAYRSAAESRYHVQIWPLDNNGQKTGLIIGTPTKDAPSVLQPGEDPVQIQRVADVDDHAEGVTATQAANPSSEENKADSVKWNQMVERLAKAPEDSTIEVVAKQAKGAPVTAQIPTGKRNILHSLLIWSVDTFLPKSNPMASLIYVVLFFIFLCIVGSIFRYFQQYLGMTVANRVVMDLRRRMYDRVVALPTGYFAQKGTSDLMSRLTQDTNTLTDGVSMAFGKAIQEPIKAVGAFVLAMCINPALCIMIVLSMPILGVIIHKFSKRMRKASRRTLESWSGMLAIINETLIGVRVVKAYSGEGYERRRFARINKKLLKEQIRLNHYASLSRPTIETLAVIVSSIPMILAAYIVLKHGGDKQSFFVLLGCFAAMFEPLRKLSDVNAKVQQSNAAGTRVFEIIDMIPEANHDHSMPRLPRHQNVIEFRDLSFAYPGHEELVLKNVDVTVKHGQSVALVGGNGSGKTTLLSLLPRLYVPTRGQVLVDGVDIATVSLRSLRSQIGLVTQDTLLFADTIYNNIAYGTRHATEAQVLDASRRAYADEFITSFPHGYETRVGEHGVRLSGGQKQRIAIARAILHDPSILILDEAMSQIDTDSEHKITLALREFTKDRTVLMIAHRFQTVINADSIICLEKGELAGVGTHAQLLETCPPYRRLYENQFRELDAPLEAETAAPVA